MGKVIHCFSSFTYEQIPGARVLASTLKIHQPEWKLWALICDAKPELPGLEELLEEFDAVVFAEDLGIDRLQEWKDRYDLPRLTAAATGRLLGKLLDDDADGIVYLDPSVAVFSTLGELEGLLVRSDAVLPAHPVAEPLTLRTERPGVRSYLEHGLGLFALKGGRQGKSFAGLLIAEAEKAPDENKSLEMFGEGHWLELLLSCFEHCETLFHPGYQTQYSAEAPPISSDSQGELLVAGAPLKLFNFNECRSAETMTSDCVSHDIGYYELCCWYREQRKRQPGPRLPSGWWLSDASADLPGQKRDIRTRYGIMRTFEETDFVSKVLCCYREWSLLEVRFLSQFLEAEHRVFDIGAFLGTFVLGLQKFAPVGTCLCVDANPRAVQLLRTNLERNFPCEYHTKLAAVGQRDAVSMSSDGFRAVFSGSNYGSLSLRPGGGESGKLQTVKLEIPLVSLRQLRQDYGAYDFLKLDIEGMEIDALSTDAAWIQNHHPLLWIECNEDRRNHQIVDFLNWAGYDIHYFAYPSFDPDLLPANHLQLNAYSFESGLLALPVGAEPALHDELVRKGCFLWPIHSRSDLREALWHTPRFALGEWEGKSGYQLAAILGRCSRGLSFDSFMPEE